MKIAKKSPAKTPPSPDRATVTLSGDAYRKMDQLRGKLARSAWLDRLIEREAQHQERERLAQTLREEYTPAVTRETLAVNQEFPVHEK